MKKLTARPGSFIPAPVTEADILAFEEELGEPVPDQLKEFWLTQNIYRAKEYEFPVMNGDGYILNYFFSPSETPSGSIYSLLHYFRQVHPDESFLPFADNPFGVYYVISLRSKDYGKVYECLYSDEIPNALTLITNSFEGFINGLVEHVW